MLSDISSLSPVPEWLFFSGLGFFCGLLFILLHDVLIYRLLPLIMRPPSPPEKEQPDYSKSNVFGAPENETPKHPPLQK